MDIHSLMVEPIGTNCYIVSEGELCAVVDPGGSFPRIIAKLEALGCTPAAILLTHSHYDHTGAVAELQEKYPDIPVYRSELDDYGSDARMEELYPPLENTKNCEDGDFIQVGPLEFEVIATPGHTHGGVTFRCGDDLFVGDTLFAGSCGRVDMPGGDADAMLSSLRRLGQLPEECRVWPGHMEPTTIGKELHNNPYMQHALRGGDWY